MHNHDEFRVGNKVVGGGHTCQIRMDSPSASETLNIQRAVSSMSSLNWFEIALCPETRGERTSLATGAKQTTCESYGPRAAHLPDQDRLPERERGSA